MAEVFSLHTHRAGRAGQQDEQLYFFDTLAEFQWVRDAAGLMPATIDQLIKPVLEICEHYDLVPWQLTPTLLDRYFAGPGKRARPTVRSKINKIDAYFAFLEQRYAGEIHRRFGAAVQSPVDPSNRGRVLGLPRRMCTRRTHGLSAPRHPTEVPAAKAQDHGQPLAPLLESLAPLDHTEPQKGAWGRE